LRLGIQIQRIQPGKPQQNGRHERIHLTLKKEATKPASFNFLQQQERFDDFTGVYNNERPHQALGGAYPGDVYTPSAREYLPPEDPEYPYHDRTIRVTLCGRICMGSRKINFSVVFASQLVGLREVTDQVSIRGIKAICHETDTYLSSFLRQLFTFFSQITAKSHHSGLPMLNITPYCRKFLFSGRQIPRRFNRCAQVMATRRSAGVWSSSSDWIFFTLPRLAGVT
jgi:hypothetical protein